MIDLRVTAAGILLPVTARAKAKRNGITGTHDGRLKVSVTQAPEKGKANVAIEKTIAKDLGIRRSQITLHSGDTNPKKEFLVTQISAADLQTLIDNAVGTVDS